MKKINMDILQKGDIILTTSNKKVSHVVKKKTKSDISHAMLYVAAGSVMDSTGDGVHSRNIQMLFYEDNCAIYVLRLKTPIDDDSMSKVIAYVRTSTATPYSTTEAAMSATILKKLGTGGKKQFCSRLVARAYASVGIDLHETPDFCTPEHLKQSVLLQFVQNASVQVSDEEVEAVFHHGDATKGMAEVTTTLLTLAQKVSPDVLSLNDITQVAINRPELDDGMADAYRLSGYLEYWRTEETRYPWRYGLDGMCAMQRALEVGGELTALIDYCNDTLKAQAEGTFKHWHDNASIAAQLAHDFPRETLKLIAGLYAKLADQNNRRIAVVQQWKRITGY